MTNIILYKELIGHKFYKVEVKRQDELWFFRYDGRVFKFLHDQECCEDVYIEDITGDLNDLVDTIVVVAESVEQETAAEESGNYATWTFLRFSTNKGSVTVRFYGESNGYYSETPSFVEVTNTNFQ